MIQRVTLDEYRATMRGLQAAIDRYKVSASTHDKFVARASVNCWAEVLRSQRCRTVKRWIFRDANDLIDRATIIDNECKAADVLLTRLASEGPQYY